MLDLRNKIVQTILVYFSLVCLFVCWSFLLRCVALVPTTAFFLFVLYLLLLGFLLIFLLTLLCVLRMWSWREMLIANWLIRPGLICLHQIKASPWGGFSLGKKILYCTVLLWTIHVIVFVWYVQVHEHYIIWSLPSSLLALNSFKYVWVIFAVPNTAIFNY